MGLMLEQLAGRVLYNKKNPGDAISKKQEVLIDPASILIYISILNSIVKCLKSCKSDPLETEVLVKHIRKPTNAREYRLLKRLIRREIGWWKWWTNGTAIMDSVVETGANTSLEEIEAVYKEI